MPRFERRKLSFKGADARTLVIGGAKAITGGQFVG